jgi:hypothetical protein
MCWGYVGHVNLGTSPVRMAIPGTVVQISMSASTLALTKTHHVYCFGDNAMSTCGILEKHAELVVPASPTSHSDGLRSVRTPRRIATGIVDILAGHQNAWLLRENHSLVVTGHVRRANSGFVLRKAIDPMAEDYKMALAPVAVALPASPVQLFTNHGSPFVRLVTGEVESLDGDDAWGPAALPAPSRCP